MWLEGILRAKRSGRMGYTVGRQRPRYEIRTRAQEVPHQGGSTYSRHRQKLHWLGHTYPSDRWTRSAQRRELAGKIGWRPWLWRFSRGNGRRFAAGPYSGGILHALTGSEGAWGVLVPCVEQGLESASTASDRR